MPNGIRVMQIGLNILHSASIVALIATGFALIFWTTRFFHFAHAIIFTAGAYLVFAFKGKVGLPMALAIPLGLVGAAILGCLLDLLIYRPLRNKKASPLILLLVSLGLYILLQNLVSMLFGDDTKVIRSGEIREGIHILGAQLTSIQLTTIVTGLFLLCMTRLFLKKTKLGRSIRAVASDPVLAELSGIGSNTIILTVMAIGSFLAGMAGILVALDVDMTPTMGMQPLMLAVVATIIGGTRNVWGIALASFMLAAAQQCAAWMIGSQWQDFTAFILLLVFLLGKPKALMGEDSSKNAV